MININGPVVEISGNGANLISELGVAMRVLGYKKKLITKEDMHDLVDQAYLSDEEIHKEFNKLLNEKMEEVGNLSRALKILKELKSEACKECPKKETCPKYTDGKAVSSCDTADDMFNNIFKDILGGDK